MMDQLIAEFTKQLAEARAIGKELNLNIDTEKIKNVLVCGLGGSGIGGKLISQLFIEDFKVPFQVVNDYFIPEYVDENTFVVVSSYSGNTEETLEAFDKSIKRGTQILAITSGGEVERRCQEKNIQCIKIPGGHPPRAALAYSLVSQMYVFSSLGMVRTPVDQDLENAIALIDQKSEDIKSRASEVAKNIGNKTPIIYADAKIEALAIRCRQQINENAKTVCWHHVFPELNHNELVGWGHGFENGIVLVLRTKNLYPRTQKRMDITKEIITGKNVDWHYLDADGGSLIEEFLYLIHLVDWISFYLAEIKQCDPVEVKVIDRLKSELAATK